MDIGDVVHLKSGGAAMTVSEASLPTDAHPTVVCHWHDEGGRPCVERYGEAMLTSTAEDRAAMDKIKADAAKVIADKAAAAQAAADKVEADRVAAEKAADKAAADRAAAAARAASHTSAKK